MALRVISSRRTDGDGMETLPAPTDHITETATRSDDAKFSADQSCKINSKNCSLVTMKPAPLLQRKLNLPVSHNKEPKFVPYEPYKAAVRPIIPKKKKYVLPKGKAEAAKCTRSRESSVSVTKSSRLMSCTTEDSDGELSSEDQRKIDDAKFVKLEDNVRKLTLENEELEKELKLQVQINAELRNLLVASVGEDIETRVSSLAVDKQYLAQKLLNTAKNLSTHHEQIEWLASQCEVWRSKFLASSVMVEELARWKASLAHKVTETEGVLKRMMDERRVARKSLLTAYANLVFLRDNFDLISRRTAVGTSSVLELSAEAAHLTDELTVRLLGGIPKPAVDGAVAELPHLSPVEKAADYMLKHPHPLNLIGEPDEACNAVVGAAVALHGHLYHVNNPPRIACCAQCTGQIKLV